MEKGHNEPQENTGKTMGNDQVSVPVIQEVVLVNKQLVETNKVRIAKKVHEENQVLDIPLIYEEIDISTVPINQYVDEIPAAVRYEGDTMIIPVLKEVTVVRVMLEKEIRVTKRKVQTVDQHTVTLKREEVIIEQVDPPGSSSESRDHV